MQAEKSGRDGLLTSTSRGNGNEDFYKPSPSPFQAVHGYRIGAAEPDTCIACRKVALRQDSDGAALKEGVHTAISKAQRV